MGDEPCDSCAKRHRCQIDKLACEALVYCVRGASLERIRFIARQPSRAWLTELTTPVKKAPPRKIVPKTLQKLEELWEE